MPPTKDTIPLIVKENRIADVYFQDSKIYEKGVYDFDANSPETQMTVTVPSARSLTPTQRKHFSPPHNPADGRPTRKHM